jgi:uncharacterized protein YydD (DUF2326 family)
MIYEVWSNRPTFKRLKFGKGLNIVLVRRSAKSTSSQKRNAAGKSSLIDVIHFVLGSDKEAASPLAAPEVAEDRYFATIDIGGATVTVERAWNEPGRLTINGDVRSWPVQPDIDEKTGSVTITNSAWRDLLGRVMFKLPAASSMPSGNFLSFRNCFSYFARRERTEGFADWRRYFRMEKPVQIQVSLGTLFGLGRDGVLELHKVKEAEKERKSLRKLLQDGLLGSAIPTVAKLRTMHRKLRSRVDRLDQELEGFHVVDAYEDLVVQADELQREIDDLSNSNLVDQELAGDLEAAMQAEAPPAIPALERLYKEAGVALPAVSLKRYDEVAKFHEAIIKNRRAHLQSELADARKRITARTVRLRKASEGRNNALELISSGGALSQYRKWDTERSKLRAEFEANTKQLELAEKIELMRGDLRVRRAEALNKITQEVVESRDILEDAASLFEEISSEIYSIPATLEIKADKDGLEFEIEHPDIGSLGVRSVQIFTFDLTMALICAKRGAWPGFLIHDSHIFDGVDGRQVARAMEIGGKRLGEIGGQYIITMNSDDLGKAEIEGNIKFDKCIVKPELDDSPAGCLFGIRFDSPDNPDVDDAGSVSN